MYNTYQLQIEAIADSV